MTVTLSISDKPIFVRPELLLHPSIPLALAGKNPRTIRGKEWWDKVRKEVYAENNFCCWACGQYQLNGVGPLHAHETYTYDYDKFTARPDEIVALCLQCHAFVHWRRIRYRRRRIEVIERGLEILADARLPLPEGQLQWLRWRSPSEDLYSERPVQRENRKALISTKWKLILDEGGSKCT